MNDQHWKPLFDRESREPTDFDVLHEGISDWLQNSLWRWLMDRAAEGADDLVRRLERRLHLVLAQDRDRPFGTQHTAPGILFERHWNSSHDRERLVFLDAILRDMQVRANALIDDQDDLHGAEQLLHAAQRLHGYLVDAGSIWGVHLAEPHRSLVRRANETTTELVAAVCAPDMMGRERFD